jgi:hypothetical protein
LGRFFFSSYEPIQDISYHYSFNANIFVTD